MTTQELGTLRASDVQTFEGAIYGCESLMPYCEMQGTGRAEWCSWIDENESSEKKYMMKPYVTFVALTFPTICRVSSQMRFFARY